MREYGLRCLLAICLIPALVSCSKTKNDSFIVIDSESIRTLAGDPEMRLAHVVVNVRGPGMNLINLVWDGKRGEHLEEPPEYFEISVPSGPDRLIQYLGVYQNENDEMQFYYADQKMSLNPGDTSVELIANAFSEPSKEITFKGQYLRGDGSAPTGKVEWLIAPPGGKPLMYVKDAFIYGGWLTFFAFEGVPITYRMKATGEVLFDRFTGDFGAPGDHLLKLDFPEFYYGHLNESSDLECKKSGRSNTTLYWGFFGAGKGGKIIKYDGASLGQFVSYSEGLYFRCDENPMQLRWSHVESVGGQSVSDCVSEEGVCIAGGDFRTSIESGYSYGPFHTYNSQVGSAYNDGPFLITRDYSPPHNITRLDWRYLPGASTDLKDIEIYTRPGSGALQSGHDDDGIENLGCSAFLKEKGFTKVRTVTATTTSITTDMDQFVGKDIAFCPRFNVAGKIVPGAIAPRIDGGAVPIISGLPGNVINGERYTNQRNVAITVTNVDEFKYFLSHGYSECPAMNDGSYSDHAPGEPFTVEHINGDGTYYLCLISRNEGGEWSQPHTAAQWVFDETKPEAVNVYCSSMDGQDYNSILISYSDEHITNLDEVAATMEIEFTTDTVTYTSLALDDLTTVINSQYSLTVDVPKASTVGLIFFRVKLIGATDPAGNEGAEVELEQIECYI